MPDFPDKLNSRAQTVIESARVGGDSVPVIVRFTEARSAANFSRQAESIGSHSVNWTYVTVPAVALSADAKGIDALLAREDVAEIWYDEPVHTMLDSSVPVINAPKVWAQFGNRGEGVTVAIVDTGIDSDHPDFAGRITFTQDFTGSGSAEDGNGHGTHVASTVAGSGAASGGKYVGVAPRASIMAARVLGSDGSGSTSGVMAGVEWAAQNGADVINLSLGSDGNSDGKDALSTLCNAVVDLGKVVVVAAGNAGPGAGSVGAPGAATKVITVGASDDGDRMASFSSRGPTADGRVKPDITAPGVKISAARATGTSMGQAVDEHYTTAQGTSMATPHVAGLCALLLHQEPGLLPADVKNRLKSTAKNLGVGANDQGSGRVDALAAVAAGNSTPPPPPPAPDPTPDPVPDPVPDPTPVPTPPPAPVGCLGAVLQLFGLLR
ncbi:MAG: S8 family serine peptidase [Caldilineaceae bacterium]|nr:S8 family serine peptidase [Caldilineaceae bacterium]